MFVPRIFATVNFIVFSGREIAWFRLLQIYNAAAAEQRESPVRGPAASAVKRSIGSTTGCTITEKAPTSDSWLKVPTSAFTFKTLCLMSVDPTVSRREIGMTTQ